jgi:hypothetical protein
MSYGNNGDHCPACCHTNQSVCSVLCCVEPHKSLSFFPVDVRPICWQRTTWILSTFSDCQHNIYSTEKEPNLILYSSHQNFARKYMTQFFSANRMYSNKESIYLFTFWGWVIELTVGNSMSNCSTGFHKKPYLYYMILYQTFALILFNGI